MDSVTSVYIPLQACVVYAAKQELMVLPIPVLSPPSSVPTSRCRTWRKTQRRGAHGPAAWAKEESHPKNTFQGGCSVDLEKARVACALPNHATAV